MASPVIDHPVLLVRDLVASRRLYAAALAPRGVKVLSEAAAGAAFGVDGYDDFAINRNDSPGYYAAFVCDLDGNTIESVFHDPSPPETDAQGT